MKSEVAIVYNHKKKHALVNIRPEQITGDFNVEINLDNCVKYQYYYKKIRDTVYKISKIGKGDWEAWKTPFNEVPYSVL